MKWLRAKALNYKNISFQEKCNEPSKGEGTKNPRLPQIKSEPLPGKHCGQGKGRRSGTETHVFTKESRNEWQLKSNVTSHEHDTS